MHMFKGQACLEIQKQTKLANQMEGNTKKKTKANDVGRLYNI